MVVLPSHVSSISARVHRRQWFTFSYTIALANASNGMNGEVFSWPTGMVAAAQYQQLQLNFRVVIQIPKFHGQFQGFFK
jgi:hypothetical protein